MDPLERKAAGLPYVYNDPAILEEQYAYQDELARYNRTMPSEHEKRREMLEKITGSVGEDVTIDTPVHANWGCGTSTLASIFTATPLSPSWTTGRSPSAMTA